TILWAAGVAASPAAEWLGANADRAGRVLVEPDLTVPGSPEIFVIGDTAHVLRPDGKPVPGVAPSAKQEGRHVAATIKARLAWWLWGVAHIYFLIGFRNRLAVSLSWLWIYFTGQRSARLITQGDDDNG
ncbi:MAG: NAD(P)/FAD-dependent oxidoreductase, partial [Mesorhizobium sp.]